MFVILVTNRFSSESYSQSKVEKILTQLDENYYYPQNKGLKRISFRLAWHQENSQFKKIFTIKNLIFYLQEN